MSDFVQDSNVIFYNYVLNYGTDPNIIRKVAHCFQVAQTCFEIASMRGYDERKRTFAIFKVYFTIWADLSNGDFITHTTTT